MVSEKSKFLFSYVTDLGPRSRYNLDLEYSYTFIYSISYLHLPSFRSQAAIVSEKSIVSLFPIEKPRSTKGWICNVKAKDEVSSDSLLTKLGIQDLDVVLRTGKMRWFGHVERSTGWISEVRKLNVVAQKRSGSPRKSWDEVIKNDRKKLDMDSADPQNHSEWRGRLRGRLVKKPNPR